MTLASIRNPISSSLLLFFFLQTASAGERLELFNGKDLTGWNTAGRNRAAWEIGTAEMDSEQPRQLKLTQPGKELISGGKCANLVTEETFGDCVLELEFMIPKGSNSGVKMMRIYEIQIMDNFGKANLGPGDCGAIYKERAPNVNACKQPGEWQTLLIDFRAPRFDSTGAKVADARFVKVVLNGQTLHENVSIPHGTNVGPDAKEQARAGVLLQGDHGPVAFRNISIVPLD